MSYALTEVDGGHFLVSKKGFTQRYGLRVKHDQFGNTVQPDFYDKSEEALLNAFEACVIRLAGENRQCSMVELGSNQAYYSMLFKAIIGNEKAKTVMVEPVAENMKRGREHFGMNGFDGIFIHKSVTDSWGENGELFAGRTPAATFGVPETTLLEIMADAGMDFIDVLHCDIDGSEGKMLAMNSLCFSKGLVRNVFLLTHGVTLHKWAKKFLVDRGYSIGFEVDREMPGWEKQAVGSDSVIVCSRVDNA